MMHYYCTKSRVHKSCTQELGMHQCCFSRIVFPIAWVEGTIITIINIAFLLVYYYYYCDLMKPGIRDVLQHARGRREEMAREESEEIRRGPSWTWNS